MGISEGGLAELQWSDIAEAFKVHLDVQRSTKRTVISSITGIADSQSKPEHQPEDKPDGGTQCGEKEATESEMPVDPGEGGVSKRSSGVQKKDPVVQARNKKIIKDFKNGVGTNAIVEKHGVSATYARKIKSNGNKGMQNRQS